MELIWKTLLFYDSTSNLHSNLKYDNWIWHTKVVGTYPV